MSVIKFGLPGFDDQNKGRKAGKPIKRRDSTPVPKKGGPKVFVQRNGQLVELKPPEEKKPEKQKLPKVDKSIFQQIDAQAKEFGNTISDGIDKAKGLFRNQPYMTPDGDINKNYTPKSEEEIEQMKIPADMKNYFYGKLYQTQDSRIRADEVAVGFDEELDQFLDQQDEQKSELERQVSYAKENATRQKEEAEAYTTAQLAQGREGVISTGNFLADEQISKVRQGAYDMRIQELDMEMQRLEDLQLEQQKGVIGARADIVRTQLADQAARVQALQESIAAQQKEEEERMMGYLDDLTESGAIANLPDEVLAYIQDGLPGAPPGFLDAIVETERQKKYDQDMETQFKRQGDAINTFTQLMNAGVELNADILGQIGAQAGMDAGALYPFYEAAQRIQQDKSLEKTERMLKLQQLGKQVENEMRGVTTQKAKAMEYMFQLHREGAPQEYIDAFAMSEGLMGMKNPVLQLDMQLKQAELAYKESQTYENYAKLQTLQEKKAELVSGTAAGSYYMPKNSLNGITSKFENGRLVINSKKAMQCGEFVNRFWGLGHAGANGMPSPLYGRNSKMALVEKNGFKKDAVTVQNLQQKVFPGMAFVSSESKWGHTGIVTAVHADGTFSTMEANIGDGNPAIPDPARPNTRSIKDATLLGFAYPPSNNADFHQIANAGDMIENELNTAPGLMGYFGKIALDQGLTGEDAEKFAKKRIEESYGSMTDSQGKAYDAYNKVSTENKHYTEIMDRVDPVEFASNINVITKKIKEEGLTEELINRNISDPNIRLALMSEMRWIEAKLRKESGAAISASEYSTAGTMYFPRAGDDAETLEIKAQRRAAIEDGLEGQMGPVGQRLVYEAQEAEAAMAPQQSSGSALPGMMATLADSVNVPGLGQDLFSRGKAFVEGSGFFDQVQDDVIPFDQFLLPEDIQSQQPQQTTPSFTPQDSVHFNKI